jgi:hypothetical protein
MTSILQKKKSPALAALTCTVAFIGIFTVNLIIFSKHGSCMSLMVSCLLDQQILYPRYTHLLSFNMTSPWDHLILFYINHILNVSCFIFSHTNMLGVLEWLLGASKSQNPWTCQRCMRKLGRSDSAVKGICFLSPDDYSATTMGLRILAGRHYMATVILFCQGPETLLTTTDYCVLIWLLFSYS